MNYKALINAISELHEEAVGRVVTAVNPTLVMRNWLIGAYIVEFKQDGEDRSTCGNKLLEILSVDLRQRLVNHLTVPMQFRRRRL